MHDLRFNRSCVFIWFAKGSNIWLGRDIWKCTESITSKTNGVGQIPQEIKKSLFLQVWRDMGREVENFYFMSKSCCISELIRFMVKEGEKRMKGSVHGDDFYSARWFGTHDREEDDNMDANLFYLHWWSMPFNGLQDETPYAASPVGNIPKFTPLDNSLNRDILNSLCFHCNLSLFFLKGKWNNEGRYI